MVRSNHEDPVWREGWGVVGCAGGDPWRRGAAGGAPPQGTHLHSEVAEAVLRRLMADAGFCGVCGDPHAAVAVPVLSQHLGCKPCHTPGLYRWPRKCTACPLLMVKLWQPIRPSAAEATASQSRSCDAKQQHNSDSECIPGSHPWCSYFGCS